MQNSAPADRFAIVRAIARRSDYGFRVSLWLAGGTHLHGHGRTKVHAWQAARSILAGHIADRQHQEAILARALVG